MLNGKLAIILRMNKFQDIVALAFIFIVLLLSGLSLLGIWGFIENDVIVKSFQTLGLIGFVTLIILAGSDHLDSKNKKESAEVLLPNPLFRILRNFTLKILIASAAVLALLGVLAIWDVIENTSVFYKSLGSVGVIAFAAMVITIVSLNYEGGKKNNTGDQHGKQFSVGKILLILIGLWILGSFLFPLLMLLGGTA